MSDHQPLEPSDAFAELGRIKLADTDIDSILAKIAALAQRAIPGADEVSATSATLLIDDMNQETRWPDYTPPAAETGAHSSLSIGLPVHESVAGALNIYATKPDAFDDDAITLAQTFADTPPSPSPTPTCTTPRRAWRSTCRPRWKAAQ
jgi:GAF domain-containing protein